MDSRMRVGNSRRGRGQPRVASGARSAPYARPMEAERPSTSRMASADAWKEEPKNTSAVWPPAQLTIRGSSGPPTVVVSNLMLGTTAEDVRMTFEQFGEVLEVYQRPPPSQNYPSVAFEVSFQEKEDAFQSIDKFDGALADGRILGVQFKSTIGDPRSPGHESMQRQLTSADLERRGGVATKELIPSPAPLPRGPEAYNDRDLLPHHGGGGGGGHQSNSYVGSSNGRNVPHHQQQNYHNQPPPTGPRAGVPNQNQGSRNHQNGKGKAPMIPTAPKAKANSKPTPQVSNKPLASRLLTPEQAKKQAQLEANKKRKAQAQAQALLWAKQSQQKGGKNKMMMMGGKVGPGGKKLGSTSLKDRLGSVPLAQRLAADSQKAGSKSDATTTAAEKEKKAAKAAKIKAKRAAKKVDKKTTSGGGDGMEVDA